MLKPRFYQRWDGCSKGFTKDCESCEAYFQIKEFEVCGWGMAFKYLSRKRKRKKCNIKDKTPINKETMEYLEEIIKNPEKYQTSKHVQLKLELKFK